MCTCTCICRVYYHLFIFEYASPIPNYNHPDLRIIVVWCCYWDWVGLGNVGGPAVAYHTTLGQAVRLLSDWGGTHQPIMMRGGWGVGKCWINSHGFGWWWWLCVSDCMCGSVWVRVIERVCVSVWSTLHIPTLSVAILDRLAWAISAPSLRRGSHSMPCQSVWMCSWQ